MLLVQVAQLCDLWTRDLEQGLLAVGPEPFLLHLSHKDPLGECLGERGWYVMKVTLRVVLPLAFFSCTWRLWPVFLG